jgi:hypothetical protein
MEEKTSSLVQPGGKMKREVLTISIVIGLLILGDTISGNAESLSLDDITVQVTKGYYRVRERPEVKPVTPRESSENLTKSDQQELWALNVVSVQNPASITSYAELLIRNGFHTDITMVEVNGKEWTRLCAGYFEDRVGAERNMEVIKSLLGMPSSPWLSRSPIQKSKESATSD